MIKTEGKMKGFIFGIIIGALVGLVGGIYLLPILTAEEGLSATEISEQLIAIGTEKREGIFSKDRQGSDAFHWGEGIITVGADQVVFEGTMAPGPDYRLYLTPQFVETEEDFLAIKDASVAVGMVKSYQSFALPVGDSINPNDYDSVIIWCEAFNQFITSAKLN
jgi:hypothetical protein